MIGDAGRESTGKAPVAGADAVRCTWIPVAIVTVVFFVARLGMDWVVPDAHS